MLHYKEARLDLQVPPVRLRLLSQNGTPRVIPHTLQSLQEEEEGLLPHSQRLGEPQSVRHHRRLQTLTFNFVHFETFHN